LPSSFPHICGSVSHQCPTRSLPPLGTFTAGIAGRMHIHQGKGAALLTNRHRKGVALLTGYVQTIAGRREGSLFAMESQVVGCVINRGRGQVTRARGNERRSLVGTRYTSPGRRSAGVQRRTRLDGSAPKSASLATPLPLAPAARRDRSAPAIGTRPRGLGRSGVSLIPPQHKGPVRFSALPAAFFFPSAFWEKSQ